MRDYASVSETIRYELPKGSILGPFHFIRYVNDFQAVLNNKAVLYEDDISVTFSESSLTSLDINTTGIMPVEISTGQHYKPTSSKVLALII
jgi:hypothetical protein